MKTTALCLLAFIFLFTITNAQTTNRAHQLIPVPVSVTDQQGSFTLKNNFSVSINTKDADAVDVAKQLAAKLNTSSGYASVFKPSSTDGIIQLKLLPASDTSLGSEGYRLNISTANIAISANKPAGLFYGMQTLLQLFPPQIESDTVVKSVTWSAPCVDIKDKPRFGWRGMMFDVSRHFFSKQDVKHFIDDMVKYKYNLLHWHLTDDEGWRIEIKSLPKLTEVGAWRVNREGKWANSTNPFPNEPKTYGGFYTQDDIKEIIEYARKRYVSVLPEVDVPGHSLAAVAAYPDLSCTKGPFEVTAGAPFMTWYSGGHDGLVDNTLCPANEKVYDFLDKVFGEVAKMFPFPYIHVGGDEVAKNLWEDNPAVKQFMQQQNIKDAAGLQSYFEKRVEKIVNSKGKRMIGWDEILEGGVSATATVMSWRGMDGGITAAKSGHKVVMTPTTFVYLDYYQGEQSVEPPVYEGLRLQKVYEFNPLPDGINDSLILGGQANLWTEQIQRYRTVQYMMWPRSLAVAEALWSPQSKRNWDDFSMRVQQQFPLLDAQGIRYSKSIYDPVITVKDHHGLPQVTMDTEVKGLKIYYSIDESIPDNYYPEYSAPVVLPADAAHIKIITYKDGKIAGNMISLSVNDLEKRE